MFTIDAPRPISGTSAWMPNSAPSTLISNTRWASSRVSSIRRARSAMPALFTRPSTRPCSERRKSASSRQPSSEVMSCARPAIPSPRSGASRSVAITVAPSDASACASVAPWPPPAPVTTTTLSVTRPISALPAQRVPAVPAQGRTPDVGVDRLLGRGVLHELDHAGQLSLRVHVDDPRAGRQAIVERLLVAAVEVGAQCRVEVLRERRPVVEAVAEAAILVVDGGAVVVLLHQLDHHVPGEAAGERERGLGGLAAVAALGRLERATDEPGAYAQLPREPLGGLLDVLDRVGELADAADGLAERERHQARSGARAASISSCG